VRGEIVVTSEITEPGIRRQRRIPGPDIASHGGVELREGAQKRKIERHVKRRAFTLPHVSEKAAAISGPILGDHKLGMPGARVRIKDVAAKTLEPGER